MRVAFLMAPEGVEEVELTEPWRAVRDAGGEPVLVSTERGRVRAFRHLDRAGTYSVDAVVAESTAEDYDALVLPGGVANPDALRTDRQAVAFVRHLFGLGRPVAAICHAPWILVEADVVRGRTLTSWPSLRTDIRNAGGRWEDQPSVVCHAAPGTLITSRRPADLEAFCGAFLHEFEGRRGGRLAA
ncbi:type 1 glutamine amidotransferase domain-containing protein [Streptomyces sp. NPDC093225]|uniref:type 1 glutamine amidotransferase domain-containing protein n=1 Tax=Streptomyces sp. NPDC093225 TaxID=3366034 RepID=UPI0037F1F1AD